MKLPTAKLYRSVCALAAALLVIVASTRHATAVEMENVRFADEIRQGDTTMRLSCVGMLRYKLFFKAYVAALYLGEGVDGKDVLADVPKRLELSYLWSVRGADFGKAGDYFLAKNVDAATFAALRPRLDRINGWYRDVRPNDRYSLTYVPGVGTELARNSERIGVIEGADFAASYYRIWLGDHPIDARLRDRLLSCNRSGT